MYRSQSEEALEVVLKGFELEPVDVAEGLDLGPCQGPEIVGHHVLRGSQWTLVLPGHRLEQLGLFQLIPLHVQELEGTLGILQT